MCLILKNWYHIKNIAKSENLLFNGNDRKWGSFFIFWYHLKKCIYSKESFSLVFADRQLQLKKMQIFNEKWPLKIDFLLTSITYFIVVSFISYYVQVLFAVNDNSRLQPFFSVFCHLYKIITEIKFDIKSPWSLIHSINECHITVLTIRFLNCNR